MPNYKYKNLLKGLSFFTLFVNLKQKYVSSFLRTKCIACVDCEDFGFSASISEGVVISALSDQIRKKEMVHIEKFVLFRVFDEDLIFFLDGSEI